MGCWGMGLTQSDEFCDVYDRFMEEYNGGKEVPQITAEILEEYHNEFADGDGILHDVYFALAKAEWMCCAQSAQILGRVNEIIKSENNLVFYRELGAKEKDIMTRKANLNKFWESLQVPRKNPRKRRPYPLHKSANLPKGAVFWYCSKGSVYGALVLEKLNEKDYLVALTESLCNEPKSVEQILDAPVYTVAWFADLLSPERVHHVGQISVDGKYNGRAGMYLTKSIYYCENSGYDRHWEHNGCNLQFQEMNVRDMLVPENVPASFRFGDRLKQDIEQTRKLFGEEHISLL